MIVCDGVVCINGGGSAPLCPLDLLEEVAQVILQEAGTFDGEVDALASHGFRDALIPKAAALLQGLGQSCDLVAGDLEVHGCFPDDFFNIGHLGARGSSLVTVAQVVWRRLPGGQYRGQQMLSTL